MHATNIQWILDELFRLADESVKRYKVERYNIISTNSLGIMQKDLNPLAKAIGKKIDIAIKLFETGIYEAQILCGKCYPPAKLEKRLAYEWIHTFENWEISSVFGMKLFSRNPKFTLPLLPDWVHFEGEFERRTAFVTMASLCLQDKNGPNEHFEYFLEEVLYASDDSRLYVKKAVDNCLRNVGKRNPDLYLRAKMVAYRLAEMPSKNAQWLGRNALREFEKSNMRMSNYPRAIYGLPDHSK